MKTNTNDEHCPFCGESRFFSNSTCSDCGYGRTKPVRRVTKEEKERSEATLKAMYDKKEKFIKELQQNKLSSNWPMHRYSTIAELCVLLNYESANEWFKTGGK